MALSHDEVSAVPSDAAQTPTDTSPASSGDERATPQLLRRFVIFQWVTLAGAVLLVGSTLVEAWVVGGVATLFRTLGVAAPSAEFQRAMLAENVSASLTVLGSVMAMTAFFIAMARARRVAIAAGVTGFDYGYTWTVASLFVPIVSLYRPWVGLGEIRRAVYSSVQIGQVGAAWKTAGGVSLATVVLAVVQLSSSALGLVQFMDASSTDRSGRTVASVIAINEHARQSLLASAVVDTIAFGALFLYLWTLAPKLRRLIPLGYGEVFD